MEESISSPSVSMHVVANPANLCAYNLLSRTEFGDDGSGSFG